MSLTLKMLHAFIDIVTEDSEVCGLDKEEEKIKKKSKIVKKNLFNTAWDLYNKKQDKKKALDIWMRLDVEDMQHCIKKIPDYVKSTPDKQYRKMFKTYLTNRSWENEIEIQVKLHKVGYIYECGECKKEHVCLNPDNCGNEEKRCLYCDKEKMVSGEYLAPNLRYREAF